MLATRIGRTLVTIAKTLVRVKGLKKVCGSSKAALKLSFPKSLPYISLYTLKLKIAPETFKMLCVTLKFLVQYLKAMSVVTCFR